MGCNNQRTNRLSRNGVCDPNNDIAAYSFTTEEAKFYDTVESLPEGKVFRAVNITATVDIPDNKERRITVSLVNSNPGTNPTTRGCVSGLAPDSKTDQPATIRLPFTNERGDFIYQTASIEIASERPEAQNEFVHVAIELTVPPTSENAEEEVIPKSFSSFFDQEGDELTFHQLKEGKGKDKIFFLHFQNKIEKTRARITLREVSPEKLKPQEEN